MIALFKKLTAGKLLYNRKLALTLWFGLSIIAVLLDIQGNHLNNFRIFRQVFYHALEHHNLYSLYPAEYNDVNLYGPFFSVLIAPFALLPLNIGAFCWVMFSAGLLLFAIGKLPVANEWKTALLLLCSHEMMTTSSWLQSNAIIAACILLTFSYIQAEKEPAAAFFMMLGAFIKIYSITGLAFFFFSRHKPKFIAACLLWSAVFFVAPMLFAGKSFILQSYTDWYNALQAKAAKNVTIDLNNLHQDISVMGFIRRTMLPNLNDLFVLLPAMLLFASQYLHGKHFADIRYRLYLLCATLIFTVIFSTGSENPTYIIALPAICLWYFMQPPAKNTTWLFLLLLIVTTFSHSDLATPWFREHVASRYSIKSLPAFFTWIIMLVQLHSGRFLQTRDLQANPLQA